MAQHYNFTPLKGTVRITSDLNTRMGAPATTSVVASVLHAGVKQAYIGYVTDGENVAGNAKWFLTNEGDFFWSGNVDTSSSPVSTKIFSNPLDGPLVCTQKFGERPDFYAPLGSPKGHNGIDFRTRDIANPNNYKKPVYAVLEGIVSEATENQWNGMYVRITHTNNCESVYLHLSSFSVAKDQKVSAGTKIGVSGNSGAASEAPHLHFGYRPIPSDKNNGYMGYIDPIPFFKDTISFV